MAKRYLAAGLSALLLLPAACGGESGGTDTASVQEVAMYEGSDRLSFLEAGAAEETGPLVWFTSSILDQAARPLADAFMKKYPDIDIEIFRADGAATAQRMAEEYAAEHYSVGVIETTVESLFELKEAEALTPFTFTDRDVYAEGSVDPEGYYATARESYNGLGYNTDLLSADDVPKTLDDLLDPEWKGKLGITGSDTGVRWVGCLAVSRGGEFVDQITQQDVSVFDVSGRALADLVISGEVALSPTIFDSHVTLSKASGAPIEWVPLEPVVVNNGAWAMPARSAHPYSAMLLIEFALSKEGQAIYAEAGYGSARTDLQAGDGPQPEKLYLSAEVDDYAQSFSEWNTMFEQLRTE